MRSFTDPGVSHAKVTLKADAGNAVSRAIRKRTPENRYFFIIDPEIVLIRFKKIKMRNERLVLYEGPEARTSGS